MSCVLPLFFWVADAGTARTPFGREGRAIIRGAGDVIALSYSDKESKRERSNTQSPLTWKAAWFPVFFNEIVAYNGPGMFHHPERIGPA